jgi:hypothetical protein
MILFIFIDVSFDLRTPTKGLVKNLYSESIMTHRNDSVKKANYIVRIIVRNDKERRGRGREFSSTGAAFPVRSGGR